MFDWGCNRAGTAGALWLAESIPKSDNSDLRPVGSGEQGHGPNRVEFPTFWIFSTIIPTKTAYQADQFHKYRFGGFSPQLTLKDIIVLDTVASKPPSRNPFPFNESVNVQPPAEAEKESSFLKSIDLPIFERANEVWACQVVSGHQAFERLAWVE
ncbi:hypothetical protein B0H19DRAFT_1083869 [Mycena capillaripes]|nr:hypothetical protein B0H19DRAFT_1083869 [Mycena capillaripes]